MGSQRAGWVRYRCTGDDLRELLPGCAQIHRLMRSHAFSCLFNLFEGERGLQAAYRTPDWEVHVLVI
jgi:hypothetical protein